MRGNVLAGFLDFIVQLYTRTRVSPVVQCEEEDRELANVSSIVICQYKTD